jgi:multiple sugar transport system ATP-binding protein
MSDLVLERLCKSYGKTPVLTDAGIDVRAGETVVVCGPSGGGKTILLRLVSGVVEPDSGDIRIAGRSVLGLGPERRDIGMAFQNFALYPHLSAFENIASPLRARNLDAAEIRKRVGEVAGLLRIEHVLGHMPRELSNGQKQRTSLARSLVRGPGVLLLDDPLRNVDAKLRYEMRLELPRLLRNFGSAVLYVTQDYKEAMALADRIAVLRAGRIEQLARVDQIYDAPESVEVARLFGDPTINLYPIRPEAEGDAAAVRLFGRSWRLPRGREGAIGRDCLLGLRPEDVRIGGDGHPGAVAFELEAVTPLNVRGVLYLRGPEGEELLATVPERDIGQFGRGHRRVWIDLPAEKLHLFDRQSGARLAPAVA